MASNEPAQVPEQDQAPQPNAVIEPISERPVADDVPYSVFPVWQKKTIVLGVSLAAVFSPMSTVGYLVSVNCAPYILKLQLQTRLDCIAFARRMMPSSCSPNRAILIPDVIDDLLACTQSDRQRFACYQLSDQSDNNNFLGMKSNPVSTFIKI